MTTYYQELKQAVDFAALDAATAAIDLVAGDIRPEQEQAAYDRLTLAIADLSAYLGCTQEASHAGLKFEQCEHTGCMTCYCPDCVDGDFDYEAGRFYATYITGRGKDEDDALCDYFEQAGL